MLNIQCKIDSFSSTTLTFQWEKEESSKQRDIQSQYTDTVTVIRKEKKHDAVTKNREGLLETGSPGKASVKIWCVNGVA